MGLKCNFLGGAGDSEKGELGGVQLFIGDTLLLDGFPFTPSVYQALDIAEMLELYPGIEPMFRHDYQKKRGIDVRDAPPRRVLLTHPHYDHVGGLPLLRHDAEVYMHRDAKRMLHTWGTLTGRNNQFLDIRDPFTLVNRRDGEKKTISGLKAMLGRNMTTFGDYETFDIGDMKVTAYPVDHSIVGSCGFIIETEIGPIAITGDIRCRGRHRERTEKFFEAALERKVQYLFTEASLLHFEHEGTEDDVVQGIAERIRGKSFASVSAPPRDLERLTSLWLAAKATGRTLCVPPTIMTYLREFEGEQGFPGAKEPEKKGFPMINDPNIAVLMLPKGKANVNALLGPMRDNPVEDEEEQEEELPRHIIEADYRFHERVYLKWKRWKNTERVREEDQGDLFDIVVKDKPRRRRQQVTLNDIRRYPDKFLVMMEPHQMIPVLTAIAGSRRRMPDNSIYIRSHPEGWNDEMRVGDAKKRHVLKAFGMYDGPQQDYFAGSITRDNHQVHVTGHMNRREMIEVLNRFGCPIVAYHTLDPRNVVEIVKSTNVIVPERGVPFTLERWAV
jgi:ribonuclease J